MNKNLLSIALLAGAAFSSANAAEYYLIKDGKLNTGVEIMPYEKPTENTIFEETVAPDGTPAFAVKNQTRYKDTRFYFTDGAIDLSKYWNLEIEFYFKDGELDVATHRGTDNGNKWSVINVGFIADTVGGKNQIEDAFCTNNFDVKIKNQPDVWNVERQMIYAPATADGFKCFTFGWQRQILDQTTIGPVYIKNLKFYSDGNRPFFADDFNTQAAYNDYFKHLQTYVVNSSWNEDPVAEDGYTENFSVLINQKCGLPLYSACSEGAKKSQGEVGLRRLYEDEGTDGSGYYDPEILHSINFQRPEGRSGRKGRSYFLIPTAGLEMVEGFSLDYICKWDGSKYATENFTTQTPADSLGMKIYYAFVDDAEEAAVCAMKPAFNEGDLLKQTWTAYHYEFPYAAEEHGKKYMAFIFDEPNFFSYCVDNIRLAATNNLNLGKIVYEEHPVGVTAYGLVTDVKNVEANAALSVSPVPATDIVTVNNDGVEKIEVINAAGAVVTSANGNQVNVAALSNGVYVIKAYTAEGVLYAKIIKQ